MRLAADANVLLAAVLGGRTPLLVRNPDLELFTVDSVLDEVSEHAPIVGARRRLDMDAIEEALGALRVKAVPEETYAESIPEARTRLQDRDPYDAKLLALALHLGMPLWSNDRDFEVARVRVFTTAMPMKRFGV